MRVTINMLKSEVVPALKWDVDDEDNWVTSGLKPDHMLGYCHGEYKLDGRPLGGGDLFYVLKDDILKGREEVWLVHEPNSEGTLAVFFDDPRKPWSERGERSLADWLNEENIQPGENGLKKKVMNGNSVIDEIPFDEAEMDIRPHPEGAKRGGYVPFVMHLGDEVFWCETNYGWFEIG